MPIDTIAIKRMLKEGLEGKFKKYKELEQKRNEEKHVTVKSSLSTLSTTMAIGAAVGTAIPVPVVGTGIGAGLGAGIGLAVIVKDEVKHQIKNRKIENACKVMKNLNEDSALLLGQVDRVIDERIGLFSKLKNTPTNKLSVKNYFVANIMKAVKETSFDSKPDVVIEGIHANLSIMHSKKIKSKKLKVVDGASVITLRGLRRKGL